MGSKWHEFQCWRCDACGTDNVILEREDDHLLEPAIFARACTSCGKQAPGKTIRPAQVGYRVVARQDWRPGRSLRHTV